MTRDNAPRAVQLFSGGLDSILAARIMKDEGFHVIGLHIYTGFNGSLDDELRLRPDGSWTPPAEVVEAARLTGVELMPLYVGGERYLEIMLNPRYGYGSAANPCIDCRTFLLERAKEVMEREGAAFVFTGEVLGQRPMSQHKNALDVVEKRSGLTGRLLRPLSAKLLAPTIPEQEGLVNREHMYDIQGRTRKRQQELAAQFGIESYPSPGGGCRLTTRQFGEKFFDLLEHTPKDAVTLRLMRSLLTGRHLRLPGGAKVIVGRIEAENDYLESLLGADFWRFEARDFQGPTVYITGDCGEEDFLKAAAITARYGKGLNEKHVVIIASKGEETRELTVVPSTMEETDGYLISRY